ncbi:MAG: SDR family oxidoreductase [Desulfosalsimonadaceae bacterium]|nr:SDR family oxidoreductase [Desulfosalsimonadaceae bacterium]
MKFNPDFWALIIGGSSGFGLATAQKLAAHGMNLCIVHRDRRGAMSRITPEFEKLKQTGVKFLSFNLDALSEAGRTQVLDALSAELGATGKLRMVLHSVAFGNLKLLAPHPAPETPGKTRRRIAEAAGITKDRMDQIIQNQFEGGADCLHPLADPPAYDNDRFLEADDFSRTIAAMGFNLVEWVKDIFNRKLFAGDARVISLTSEGGQKAWRGYAAVSAAKAVLESAARSMALEFAPFGIRSNIIQAGVTDTAALRIIPGSRHLKANAIQRNPFGRLTEPSDVANVIYLLCLDEAAWINGALICADGGEGIA